MHRLAGAWFDVRQCVQRDAWFPVILVASITIIHDTWRQKLVKPLAIVIRREFVITIITQTACRRASISSTVSLRLRQRGAAARTIALVAVTVAGVDVAVVPGMAVGVVSCGTRGDQVAHA